MLDIKSRQNATFRKVLSLTSAKGIKKEGLFLLSGEKLIREFLAGPNLGVAFELITPGKKLLTEGIGVLRFSPELFAEIDVLGTRFNILVVELPEIAVLADMRGYKPRGIEVVLPVGDPGNLGALIRSCEAFSVPRVILTREAAHPFLPKSVKASAGSVLRVPLARGPSLGAFSESCIALDINGAPIAGFKWPADGLLVVGEEGAGFAAEGKRKFKNRLRIPTKGVQSLNVVVAASIALVLRPD